MIVKQARIYSFGLPLVEPLILKGIEIKQRDGLLLRIIDETGVDGWGEISPLPGLSSESLSEALAQSRRLPGWMVDQTVPEECKALSGALERWLQERELYASVRFGLESAVLNCLASGRRIPLHTLLGAEPLEAVRVNALLNGSYQKVIESAEAVRNQDYRAVKVKVGRMALADDAKLVRQVAAILNGIATVRLDANRTWDLRDALIFAESIADTSIEYVEEPCRTLEESQRFHEATGLPIAIDETLLEIEPRTLASMASFVSAVILKPTLLGGIERTVRFAREAQRHSIKPVISSTFETSIGIITLANVAACIGDGNFPVGLDTLSYLGEDISTPRLEVLYGYLALPRGTISPNPDHLRERNNV